MFHKHVLIGSALAALVVNTALMPAVAQAQLSEDSSRESQVSAEPTTETLASAILERIPDVPATAHALGRGVERPARARAHAEGILAAVAEYRERWAEFARRGGWSH